MPRERWSWMCPFWGFTYSTQLHSQTSYEYVASFFAISKLGWFIGLSSVTLLIVGWTYLALRRAPKGTVTDFGIKVENGPVIPLACIDRIVCEGDGFPSTVFTEKGEKELHIADREFVKFAKTSLNQWAVKGEKVTMTSGETGQDLQIRYKPRGKYCTYRLNEQESIVLFVLCAMAFLESFFKLGWTLLIAAALVGWLLFFKFPIFSHKVEISVSGNRILLKDENLAEYSLRFSDVASIDQGLFQVKVTAKDGKEVYFPQGFVLLPELIEEFAGL